MSSIAIQRDLVVAFKKETCLNIGILNKLQPMLPELTRLVFKENALEKPTQNLFYHLTYYLVSIIDPQVGANFSWPLYDSKAERVFRNELYMFISDYSGKSLITPVMSSYLVNPSCYKVTVLIFQLSQLAVNKILSTKMQTDSQRKLYHETTEKYKFKENDFINTINKEVELMSSKLSNYLCKRQIFETMADMICKRIVRTEEFLLKIKAQEYIENLVDGYLSQHEVDNETTIELSKIKNVHEKSQIFDRILKDVDLEIDSIESNWDCKVTPYLKTFQHTKELTEALILRHTGQVEKSLYTVEYNSKTDAICTKDLQNLVNAEQKYVLMNLEVDGKLHFPNLIRAFVISISCMLKNNVVDNEIYKFYDYLESGTHKFNSMVTALRVIIERVRNAEAKLQNKADICCQPKLSVKQYIQIPPIPDLSDIRINRNHIQAVDDNFTPINVSKNKFNLRRRVNNSFIKPHPKPLMTSFHQSQNDDFLKSIISGNRNINDQISSNHISHNFSVISHISKGNETIAECSSGFTRAQIQRLLSTRKNSSSKKYKNNENTLDINVKKGALFNESLTSNDSNGLFRSYSSPNLYENRTKRCKSRVKELSIMQENSPFEVSGISAFDNENFSPCIAESSRKLLDTLNPPAVLVTNEAEKRLNSILNGLSIDSSNDKSSILSGKTSIEKLRANETQTPKSDSRLVAKTSSLEKLINRFKKVRANVVTGEDKPIIEEKANVNTQNANNNKRILLPDLLSPSCNMFSSASANYLDDFHVAESEVQSLGAASGADHTYSDQFGITD